MYLNISNFRSPTYWLIRYTHSIDFSSQYRQQEGGASKNFSFNSFGRKFQYESIDAKFVEQGQPVPEILTL